MSIFFKKICKNAGLTAEFARKLYAIIQNDSKPSNMI